MFTMHKVYQGEDVPLPPLYVDEVGKWYTWEDVKIQAHRSTAQNWASRTFNGVDDAVDCGDISEINGASTLTIAGWATQDTLDIYAHFFWKSSDSSNFFACYTYSNGNLYLDLKNTGTNTYAYCDYSTVVTADTWFHWTVVFDGTQSGNANRLKFYVDGVLVSLIYYGTIPATIADLTGASWFLSRNSQAWNGTMAEVQIFTRALSAPEVFQLSRKILLTEDRIRLWLVSLEEESLILPAIQADAYFSADACDYPFPLRGAAFLTPQTGTLKLRVTQSLSSGLYLYPVVTEIPRLAMAGSGLAGMGRYASQDVTRHALLTYVQVQVVGNANPFTYTVPMVTN